jgi:hypothetical protein
MGTGLRGWRYRARGARSLDLIHVGRYGVYGPNACNDFGGGGNVHIQSALVERLPPKTLRAALAIGADCDDRETGTVAAAWGKGVRPAEVVDLLTAQGWARTDPAGGAPSWYVRRATAGDASKVCLADEEPQRGCNLPLTSQIVLTAERGDRVFVARLHASGLTVDAAHKRDGESVRAVRAGQCPAPKDGSLAAFHLCYE